jgi:hypothetical protein
MTTPKLPRRSRQGLTISVRAILSDGIDFFSDLEHLEPIPKDRWGHIQRNLWVYAGKFPRSEYDPPEGLPDARIDFLREQWSLHKDEVVSFHIAKWRDGTRPWGWWMWGSPPEPCPQEEITDVGGVRWKIRALAILLRHGLLWPEEQEWIHAEDVCEAALRADSRLDEEGG